MPHSILARLPLLSLLLLLCPITHSSSAASAAASAASSPTRCLVHSSGIARVNSLYRRTSQSTFASNNENVALARVRLSKGKYYWVLRRKKMVLYKSEVVGGKTRAPPATGWSAEDGARLPLPTVECDGGGGDLSDLAAASTRARASALCPDKGTLCAIMLLKGVTRAKRVSGAGAGAGSDADSDSDSDSARQRRAHLAIMNGTMAAEAKRFGKFNWMFVDAECQHRFALAYGIEQDKLPTMVVLNAAKARYAPFVGGFTVPGLSEFISSMMTGHLRTSVLRGDIPILDNIPCPGMGSGSGSGSGSGDRGSGDRGGGGGGGSGAGRAGAGGGKDEGDEQQHESEERREEAAGMMEEVRREEEEEGKAREREVVEMMRQDEERENAEVAKAHARLAKDTAERKKKRKEEQFKVKREARKKKTKRRRGKKKKKKDEVKAKHDEL
jgi:hypothetical protein